jgi:hypothetical protein
MRRDARKRELANEQWGIQPRVPFFLFDELLAFSVQLREEGQLWRTYMRVEEKGRG